jgi:YgiT-type zinc finger domain-containing protein
MMKCIVQGCPGEMEERRIMHTFVRGGNPIVVENLPAWVCPVCGYTVLDLEVLDSLFAFDPETAVIFRAILVHMFSAIVGSSALCVIARMR